MQPRRARSSVYAPMRPAWPLRETAARPMPKAPAAAAASSRAHRAATWPNVPRPSTKTQAWRRLEIVGVACPSISPLSSSATYCGTRSSPCEWTSRASLSTRCCATVWALPRARACRLEQRSGVVRGHGRVESHHSGENLLRSMQRDVPLIANGRSYGRGSTGASRGGSRGRAVLTGDVIRGETSSLATRKYATCCSR